MDITKMTVFEVDSMCEESSSGLVINDGKIVGLEKNEEVD